MPGRCEDDIEKKLKAKHAKILEMKQKESEERMAEHERLLQLEKDRYEKLQAELLERERLASILLSSRPRVTWRVDDATMQHSESLSESKGSAEREKSATSYLSEVVSVIIEAENLLDGCGAHPETIPNLIERIRRIEPFSPKFEDSISAEHFQLQVIAKRTLLFLIPALSKRGQEWKELKKTHEEIKRFLEEYRQVLDAFPTDEKSQKRKLVQGANDDFACIQRSLSSFEKLEELFSGDENMDSSSYDEYNSHKQSHAFFNEFLKMKEKFISFAVDALIEEREVEYFYQSEAEIKIKVSHVEELVGLLNQNQFATLSNTIDNALKSVEAEIEKVEEVMKECELNNKFVTISFTRIEDLHSKLKILKDNFSEALENQQKVPKTEKPNQEAAILEMFSQLTPEDARNLFRKLQDSYGVAAAKPEEKVEIPKTIHMPTEESEQGIMYKNKNLQRVEQEEIRAWASRLQNSKNQAGNKNNS
ncbi:hypothetical protein CAEBREN_10157 [Caenorhabditis brenneri]|uniref:Uncharacterized protein n=1 Tax=Caenorhabditis brenneri TaxID=135651 RepID=G0MA52_CAEBE|nr:hypothetical protein CAEBREN_10157 [Caenorhabditis brenneri]